LSIITTSANNNTDKNAHTAHAQCVREHYTQSSYKDMYHSEAYQAIITEYATSH